MKGEDASLTRKSAEAPAVRQVEVQAPAPSVSRGVQGEKKAEPRTASRTPASKVNSVQSSGDTSSRPLGSTSFSVQAGAFLSKDNAEARISVLRSQGFDPYLIQEPDSQSRLWHTVHIGKYPTRDDARVAAKAVSEKTRVGTVVRVFDGL